MAAGQASTKSFSIVQILHLVFTILSIAVLSYKVYHLESELSFIRDKLSAQDSNSGKTLLLSTAATIDKQFLATEEVMEMADSTRKRLKQLKQSKMYSWIVFKRH